jgi:peptidoglycan/LPS O-acetylase OafA/YrhL
MAGMKVHDRGHHWWRTRSGIVLCGFLLIAAFYLLTEHTAHVFGALPFLFILACPLMHLFMHHGHGSDGSRHAGKGDGS